MALSEKDWLTFLFNQNASVCMHRIYKLRAYIMPTCQIVFMAEAWRLLLQRLHIIIEANVVTVKNTGAYSGEAPDILSRIMHIAANPYHNSSLICQLSARSVAYTRVHLLKICAWLLHRIGAKVPPSTRDSSEVVVP